MELRQDLLCLQSHIKNAECMCMEGRMWNELFQCKWQLQRNRLQCWNEKPWNYCTRSLQLQWDWVNMWLVRREGMTWHGTVIKMFPFNVSLVQKDQVTKYSPQIPFQLLKRHFSTLHCSKKTFFILTKMDLRSYKRQKMLNDVQQRVHFPSPDAIRLKS